jgi:hypothetical protein
MVLGEQRHDSLAATRADRDKELLQKPLARFGRYLEAAARLAQPGACAVNQLPAGGLSLAEHLRHFGIVVLEDLVQQKRGPLLRAEALENC